jgi:hypothetical protein
MAIVVDYAYPEDVQRGRGAYTVLKKIRLDAGEVAQWITVPHHLGRVPNWVRVTKLTKEFTPLSPVFPAAECCPGILPFTVEGTDLEWDPGLPAPGPYPDGVIDLTDALYFGVYNSDETHEAYFLVEFGITHSSPR